MGRKGSEDEEALPPSVIAQAGAAIAANTADGSKSHDRHAPKDNVSNATSPNNIRSSHLQVPEIVEPLPAYGEHMDEIEISQDGFDTTAKLTDDGRVNIRINQKTRRLSDLLVPALRNQLSLVAEQDKHPLPPGYIPPALGGLPGQVPPPPLNVVIHVVGSRGDVQPFVALGKTLKSTYGHRVRLATHPTFQPFVEENGLEFFSIGGDPAELMAFMVKNPGLMPGFDSLKSGDVGKRRKGMEELVLGCWRSCIEPGDGLGTPVKLDQDADRMSFDGGINVDCSPTARPFIADAIIANPPSFAHIHIAEKLGIPLHMMFTMPWSPTQSFPHPLANIQSSNADVNMTNFMSYALVEMMTWQGLGDVINRFRERALGLEPISLIWAPGMLQRLRVPYTYCWSPALIPKPNDWAQHISISGFYFLSLASSYTPHPDLAEFLAAGPPPVYIGFGSIVVDDPNAMTKLIFEAVQKCGCRALVSKGWGGLGADELGIPEGVFMLGNVPHDWLFKHVAAVVHHGGAGTTAAGIALGCPTVVVPFFGDQPFWGNMIFRAGAGPAPIPFKQLTAEKLAVAITEALKPTTLERAKELGGRIREEKGTEVGGKAFHDHLKVDELRCSLAPSQVAVWSVKRTKTQLSALAATVLANEGLLTFADLKLYRPREYETEDGPWDPISGGASALIGTMASMSMGIADIPVELFRAFKSKGSKSGSDSGSDFSNEPSPVVSPPESTNASQTNISRLLTQRDSGVANDEATAFSTSTSSGPASTKSDDTLPTSIAASRVQSPTTSRPGNHLRRPSSQNNSRDNNIQSRSKSPAGSTQNFDPSKLTLESAIGAGKGVSRIVSAGLKSPMDFTMGLARGFHNAPKLYGDDTVRPQEKVTDFQSGLKAAGKEFGFGFYDGLTGLVTQPMRGAEKEGAAGLLKGIGRGIGGLVLKPGAAIWGLPGYTLMGIHKEVRKIFGTSVSNYIISARTAQGYEQWKSSTPEERQDIISRWNAKMIDPKGEMQYIQQAGIDRPEGGKKSPKGFFQTRHLSFEERKKLHESRQRRGEVEDRRSISPMPISAASALQSSAVESSTHPQPETTEEFEHAIKASVASTSRGDAAEDLLIERAIRASVRELQSAQGSHMGEEQALESAIQASVAEAARRVSSSGSHAPEDAEYHAALQRSLQDSLNTSANSHQISMVDREDDMEDDEEIKKAIEASKDSHKQAASARTEEEIVLEYVKKQSLLEEQHKQAVREKAGVKSSGSVDAEEDEDMKRAIEESAASK